MAGYWPSSFFACLWTETRSRSINSQKKRTRPISSYLDRTNLVNKEFIIWLSENIPCRIQQVVPRSSRWLNLARSGSQSQRAIWVILPAREVSHIISMGYLPSVRSRWLDIGQVLFCVFMDRDEVKVQKLAKKKKQKTRLVSSHLDRTNLVNKGFITWLSGKFFLPDTAGSPEQARWLHLALSGGQSQRAIWVILPARGASHLINMGY